MEEIENRQRPIATNVSTHIFHRITTPYKQAHTQRVIRQVINIFEHMTKEEVSRNPTKIITIKLEKNRRGVYVAIGYEYHIYHFVDYLDSLSELKLLIGRNNPFMNYEYLMLAMNEAKKEAAQEVLNIIYDIKYVANRDEFVTNIFKKFDEIYDKKKEVIALKFIDEYKNIENKLLNVRENKNILLTNVTSFLSNNNHNTLSFHKIFKKHLLSGGKYNTITSKFFTKLFREKYEIPYIIDTYAEKISSGSFGIVYGNNNINKNKLNQITKNKLIENNNIPIIVKKQNINTDSYPYSFGEINELKCFNYYKEALIQYILYTLSEEPFKLQIPKVYSFKYMEPKLEYKYTREKYSITIMQQIEGITLYDYLKDESPILPILPPLTIIHYMKQIFSLMNYLYEQFGFIHGDIKSNNIMVQTDGKIILIDYGFSSINKLPNIENLNSNFLLSAYIELYNKLKVQDFLMHYDITMILCMYCRFILKFYTNRRIRSILETLFLDDILKDSLVFLINRPITSPSILRNKIDGVDYAKISYSNLLAKIDEIESALR